MHNGPRRAFSPAAACLTTRTYRSRRAPTSSLLISNCRVQRSVCVFLECMHRHCVRLLRPIVKFKGAQEVGAQIENNSPSRNLIHPHQRRIYCVISAQEGCRYFFAPTLSCYRVCALSPWRDREGNKLYMLYPQCNISILYEAVAGLKIYFAMRFTA